ncbi:MAG: putative ABC transport system permease protein [Rhodothermales bacterium]|jgi:putative ABC transport system permease protein
MLKNYLVVAVRALQRQKLYSAINIFSLAVGIACCTLILLFVRHEWSADAFHDNVDDIYRVYRIEQRVNGDTKRSAGLAAPLGPAMMRDLPNVELAVRMRSGEGQVQLGSEVIVEPILYADAGFFDLFTFPLSGASSANPLQNPQSVVLSTDLAEKYFGEAEAVGKTISLRLAEVFQTYTVTGVAAPLPNNSSITFDFVVPFAQWPGYGAVADVWGSFNSAVYLRVSPGTGEAALQAQIDPLVDQYYSELRADAQAAGWWIQGGDAFDFEAQPMREVHFSVGYTSVVASTGNPENLYVLMGIGLVVLLLASVNFMTLAAGRGATRAREVGVRKALGAHRGHVAQQFMGEAMLLSGLALGLGILMAGLLLPLFNELADANLGMQNVDFILVAGLAGLTALCGFAAGSYPALVLSRYRPAEVLKGEVRHGGGLLFTRALVVLQFTISIGMIACTLVMFSQLNYMQTKSLGFADAEIVAVDLHAAQTEEEKVLDRFRQRIEARADVLNVTSSSYSFGDGWSRSAIHQEEREIIVYTMRTDPAYIDAMGMRLVAGRNFSESLETDREEAVIINETLAGELGWEDPVGHLLPGYEESNVTIIGVVADYHFQSLRSEIEPVFLHMSPALGSVNYALLRVSTDRIAATLAALGAAWGEVAPDQPFVYEFMDQRLDALYAAERRWSRIVQAASAFALAIACLGLFGLATLSVERRRKEVGLRKVLGASSASVAILLSTDFARLVVVAFVLACPLAYLIMDRWFDGFAYHTELGVGVFALSGGLALVVALLTISIQALKSAMGDPVKSLRYE